jgi:peptidoglycan hydrolase-like protein with peptidoglycan-binding domain
LVAATGFLVLSTLILPTGNATALTRDANAVAAQACPEFPVRPQPSVQRIQCLLNLVIDPATYPLIPVDGEFGPATAAKVKKFQQCAGGLAVDGRVGPRTMAALEHWASTGTYVC